MQKTRELLTREDFRQQVRQRDRGCVGCQANEGGVQEAAQAKCEKETQELDAHHIFERKLFQDGGYYLWNGVSLCNYHHLRAERGSILPAKLLLWAGSNIPTVLHELRSIFGVDLEWDDIQILNKWGEYRYVPAGTSGFEDVISRDLRLSLQGSSQRDRDVICVPAFGQGTTMQTNENKHIKYPRTYHLPWSPNLQNDDRRIDGLEVLENSDDIVVTEKMDGENTTFYNDHIHARSLSSVDHPSRSWVKQHWAGMRSDIPDGMRICGENLYARHSIHYADLTSFYQVFNIWIEDVCLSWDATKEWVALTDLTLVPELYRGKWDRSILDDIQLELERRGAEGYTVRVAKEFNATEYPICYAKFVRRGHVQTGEHWMTQEVVPNGLASLSTEG